MEKREDRRVGQQAERDILFGGDEEKRVTLSCLSRKLGNVFV